MTGVWVSVQVYVDNIAIRIYRYRHDRERDTAVDIEMIRDSDEGKDYV